MEPLPAGARTPPAPPRPPAPPTTGWQDRPFGWPGYTRRRPTVLEFLRQCWQQLQKVGWPTGPAVRRNAALVALVVGTLLVLLSVLEVGLVGLGHLLR